MGEIFTDPIGYPEFRTVLSYISMFPEVKKIDIYSKLFIATILFGMGIDCLDIHHNAFGTTYYAILFLVKTGFCDAEITKIYIYAEEGSSFGDFF